MLQKLLTWLLPISMNITVNQSALKNTLKKNHVSTSWFIRNFKLYVGSTPMQFILQKSICNAEALLLNTEYNINEIAQIVGYDNALYFSRMFKKIKGISPSEYRKNI